MKEKELIKSAITWFKGIADDARKIEPFNEKHKARLIEKKATHAFEYLEDKLNSK